MDKATGKIIILPMPLAAFSKKNLKILFIYSLIVIAGEIEVNSGIVEDR